MSVEAPPRLFTAEEFFRMGEIGIFGPDERIELLEGELVPMLPPGPWHGGAINWLNDFFSTHPARRWGVSVQNTFRATDYDAPLPDLAIIRYRTDQYKRRHPRPADTFLLIEVADSSVQKDRVRKSRIYAQAHIPEYWIVIEPESLIEVFRSPAAGKYTVNFQVRPGEPLAPEAFSDVALDTADLFS